MVVRWTSDLQVTVLLALLRFPELEKITITSKSLFIQAESDSKEQNAGVCQRRREVLLPSGGEPPRTSLVSAFLAWIMGQTQSGAEKAVGLQDTQELYRKFASECPSGNLHLHEFKRIFGINSSFAAEESATCGHTYAVLPILPFPVRHFCREGVTFDFCLNFDLLRLSTKSRTRITRV